MIRIHLISMTTADIRLPILLAEMLWHLLFVSLHHNDHIVQFPSKEGSGKAYLKRTTMMFSPLLLKKHVTNTNLPLPSYIP